MSTREFIRPPRRRSVALVSAFAFATVMVLAGCGGQAGGDTGTGGSDVAPEDFERDGEGVTVAGSSLWSSNPAVKLMNDSTAAAIEARGATSKILEANSNDPVNSLVGNLDSALATQPNVAWFWPIDPDALTAVVNRAVQSDVPVVSFETTKAPVAVTIHGARDIAAMSVANAVCTMLADGGDVVFGDYAYPDPNIALYKATFTEALQECSGGSIEIAAEFQNKTDDIAGAIDPAIQALQRAGDAKVIVNYSDVTAIGASRAADQLGIRDQVTIFGLNLDPTGFDALEKGTIDYSLRNPVPLVMQYAGNTMVDLALGKDAPKYVTYYLECFSTATVDQVPDNAKELEDIRAGRSLLTGNESLIAIGETEAPAAPAVIPECPVE